MGECLQVVELLRPRPLMYCRWPIAKIKDAIRFCKRMIAEAALQTSLRSIELQADRLVQLVLRRVRIKGEFSNVAGGGGTASLDQLEAGRHLLL